VALYRFDERRGTVVRNHARSTGTAFNGTLLGTPLRQPSTRPRGPASGNDSRQ
jgi:hypothetical protein